MSGVGYELVDCGGAQRLERFGDHVLARPCAQAVWPRCQDAPWRGADARFERDAGGSGRWLGRDRLPKRWPMSYAGIRWTIHPNEHGNVGIFPEQEECWRWIDERVRARGGTPRVLNLFAYTGGSTLAAAAAGARVVHLDASRTSVQAARDNAASSGLGERPVRWIVDDAVAFVAREERRGHRYDGIVLDPPTYGRGSGREMWRIERDIVDLLAGCRRLLEGSGAFLLLTSHSPGFTPAALANLVDAPQGAALESGEMIIRDRRGRALPSGAFARWSQS